MSVALPAARAGNSFVLEIYRLFRSVQLAIVLISCLAIGVLVGVFMPQEGLVETFEIKRQFGQNYHLLKAFGLFNVFTSPWFLALEILFFFNLLLGSFIWLRPAVTAATTRQFFPVRVIQAAPNAFELPASLEAVTAHLKRNGYRVFADPAASDSRLYATRGQWTRFGPATAHIGILLMLLASVYGAMTGFKAQKIAVPGETFSLVEADTFNTNVAPTFWQGDIPPWKVRVNDFKVQFYKDHPETPQQYYCNLDLLAPGGQVLANKTIAVNHPITLGDLTIYQASFAPTGKLFLEVNGKPLTVNANSQFQGRPISMHPLSDTRALVVFPFFAGQDPGVTKNHVVAFIREGEGFMGAAPGKMPDNLRLPVGQAGEIGGVQVKYVKPELATGLQIKQAPEVLWMYLAYIIICTGTFMCLPSQRMLWLSKDPGGAWHVLPKTNKDKLGFERELLRFKMALQGAPVHG
jgi:cytochrome c biogenesis protein